MSAGSSASLTAGSYTAGNILSFGAGGGYLTGTRDSEYLMDHDDPTEPDVAVDTETDFSGMIARARCWRTWAGWKSPPA